MSSPDQVLSMLKHQLESIDAAKELKTAIAESKYALDNSHLRSMRDQVKPVQNNLEAKYQSAVSDAEKIRSKPKQFNQ